jgi:hypothetical protein
MGGSETDPLSNFQTITKSLNTITENTNTQINQISNFSSMEFKPLEIKEDMKVSLDVKLDPDSKNQALTQLMTTALEMFFQGGGNKDNVNMVLEELNKLKTNQGLTLNQTKESLVNMPGKKEKILNSFIKIRYYLFIIKRNNRCQIVFYHLTPVLHLGII